MSRPKQAALHVVVGLLAALVLTGPLFAQAQRTPAQLWDDFNHYVLIARPDLAAAAGEALLNAAEPAAILDVVEASDFKDLRALDQGTRIDDVREVAARLAQTIQDARIARSREDQRIAADIELLDKGQRPFSEATERLRAAGQYAAPQLLATLLDDSKSLQHPSVLSSIVSIGRPLVYPLSVALPDLPPVTQRQIAQALAEIGYPLALPYMKRVLEDAGTDPSVKQTVQTAYNLVAAHVRTPTNVSAAELFYQLGMSQYTAASVGQKPVGFDPATGKGLVWAFIGVEGGLVPTPVPGEIFGDVLAMRDAQQALALDARMDKALTLWLMANLRRENRLPEGQTDPSYPGHLQPASYYAMLAGPQRQHEVLNRALDDGDAALALDAIAALGATAGPDALVNKQGAVMPLIRALTYPDRRVRYSAAIALAHARPKADFPESYRVVPVLAEAVRQTDTKYAVVVGRTGEDANSLRASVAELGYETYADTSLDAMRSAIAGLPGVDLVVISGDADAVESFVRRTGGDYKLATVPVLAIVTTGDQIELSRRMNTEKRLSTTVAGDPAQLRSAVEQSAKSLSGEPIAGDEATGYATRAIDMLGLIALENKGVLNPMDAQPALVSALSDDRDEVAVGASRVLAMLDSADAQKAVATAALASSDPQVQVPMLKNLATSANTFGNRLEASHTDRLLELVKTGDGDTALAAAQAHGALQLPTSHAVELLLVKPTANGQ